MKNSKTALWIMLSALAAFACAKDPGTKTPNTGTTDTDSVSLAVESAVSSVNGLLNDTEQNPNYSQSVQAATCDLTRFSPAVGSADCSGTAGNKTVTSTFNSCTAGTSNEFKLAGVVTLAFSSSGTCDTWIAGVALPTSGDVTRTTSSFVRTNPNGSTVTTSTDTHVNYLGQTLAGGEKTTFAAGFRTVNISGLHRIRKTAGGDIVFDHSVTTPTSLTVTGTKVNNNRAISAGTLRVDNNRARYSISAGFSGVTWGSSCCYPTAGTVTFTVTGTIAGSLIANFSSGTCGQVAVTDPSGEVTNVQLASCE